MVSVLFLSLIIAIPLDWAKTCNPVNYDFKNFGTQHYGYGCKKGCVGYSNVTTYPYKIDSSGRKLENNHYVQDQCMECSKINAKFVVDHYLQYNPSPSNTPSVNDTELEKICNGGEGEITIDASTSDSSSYRVSSWTCHWNSKKKECGAVSCPKMANRENCNGNWTDGKCSKNKDDFCNASSFLGDVLSGYDGYDYDENIYKERLDDKTCINSVSSSPSSSRYEYVTCSKLTNYYHYTYPTFDYSDSKCEKYTSDHAKDCEYRCEHPESITYSRTYEYTKATRNACNKVYGCMYTGNGRNPCSYFAIWAFVLILVFVILFVVAIIVVIIIIVIKFCGSKSKKVDPAAGEAAAPTQSSPPQSQGYYAPPPQSQAGGPQKEGGETQDRANAPPPEVGPYLTIKLASQQQSTTKNPYAIWQQTLVFNNLGAEDDEVDLTVFDENAAPVGTASVRIPEYVNNNKHVSIPILDATKTPRGALEIDIEIKVQEQPTLEITGVFQVDKFVSQ